MNTITEIKRLNRCLDILDGINGLEKRIRLANEHINGFCGTFPQLKRKYLNDIHTRLLCIQKLEKSYYKTLNQN